MNKYHHKLKKPGSIFMKQLLKTLLLTGMMFCFWLYSEAQVITCIPSVPNANDSVTVIFNATFSTGTNGLKDYSGDVYVHTGIITSASVDGGDWKHAPTWLDNSPKYLLRKTAANLYEFKIKPSIKEFYDTKSSEIIKKLAFVFRNADGTKEGKGDEGSDIFYDVVDTNLHVIITSPLRTPVFVLKEDSVIVTVFSPATDSIQISLNNQKIVNTSVDSFSKKVTFDSYGKYWLKVKTYKNSLSASDSFYVFVRKATQKEDLPQGMQDGINYLNDSTVILCLVAPKKASAFVIGEFNDWEPDSSYQMRLTSDSSRFWIKINNLVPGKEYSYQYIVDGSIKIADPFAQKVLDPSNDKLIDETTYPGLKSYPAGKTEEIVSVLQTARNPYHWKYTSDHLPARQDLIIYELLIRDFVEKHSYKAVIDTLGYLKKLGINAIELMPVMEFEGNISWGYNPSFYFAPDKYYGTSDDLKAFVDTCHALGIAVIFDIVLNHSFGQSPMVRLYWDTKNKRPAADNPWFNPVAKHDYNVGYDFNHESKYTKLFVSQVLKFWLTEYKADGFRFDLSKGFTQKNTLGNAAAWGMYDATRVKILENISDTIWEVKNDAFVILEHLADNSEEKVLVSYGMMVWGKMKDEYSRAAKGYNISGMSNLTNASYKARTFDNPGLVAYMESHDEERQMREVLDFGNNENPNYNIRKNLSLSLVRAELAAAFFFTIPGPKMIWQFGELGYDYSIEYNGRTGLKPIRWEYYNEPVRLRLYSVYKELIGLRNNYPAFNSSDFTLRVADSLKVIAISHSSMDIRIIGNFSLKNQYVDASFSKTGYWYDYFSGDSLNVTDIHQPVELGESEYRIYTTKKLSRPNIFTAPEVRNVTIGGTLDLGSALLASYQYFDLNGDIEGLSEYKWYRGTSGNGAGKTLISGETGLSYPLTVEDDGHFIFFEVTPVAQTGNLLRGIPQYATVLIGTKIETITKDNIIVYPNPFVEQITIDFNGISFKECTVEVNSVLGQALLVEKIKNCNRFELALHDLRPGIYVLSVRFDDRIIIKNILK
jgi:1,4-alpha-glucan branching enzyme